MHAGVCLLLVVKLKHTGDGRGLGAEAPHITERGEAPPQKYVEAELIKL